MNFELYFLQIRSAITLENELLFSVESFATNHDPPDFFVSISIFFDLHVVLNSKIYVPLVYVHRVDPIVANFGLLG